MATVVDSDGFRDWMTPKVEGLRAFVASVDRILDERGWLPSHDSRAMGELAAEQTYRGRSSWENPIRDTHTFGAMTLRAATDYVRGFGQLFDGPHPPLYAHVVVGRAALESAVVSEWLSEPAASPLDRIKRGLCEHLYSALEVDRLGLPGDDRDRVPRWTGVADSFGWRADTSRPSNPSVDGTRRPRVSDGIVRLSGSPEGSEVGNLLFSRTSAVSHVTWFGIQSAFDLSEVERNAPLGDARVPMGTNSERVSAIAFYVLRVVRAAATARFTLMGWTDPSWTEAVREAVELENVFGAAALAAGEAS
jgi:hypothetical protein